MMSSGVLMLLPLMAMGQGVPPGGRPWLPSQMTECWHEGRWHPEGTPVVRGRYHYLCRGGELQPEGCVSRGGVQHRTGQSWNANGFQKSCLQDVDGRLKISMTGCAPVSAGGRAFRPGESWNDPENKFWFSCKQANEWSVQSEIGGCVDFQGRRVPTGDETTIKDDIWWVCGHRSNGAVGMCVGGCMHNGRKHRVGETWPDGEYAWYCKTTEDNCDGRGRVERRCVGCEVDGNRLNDGDRYHRDESVFQCDVRPEYQKHRLVGCAQRSSGPKIERKIGCRWFENHGDQHFEMECTDAGGKAKSQTIGCIYMEAGKETVLVPPDSYTSWWTGKEEVGLACKPSPNGNGQYALDRFPLSEVNFRAQGMRFKMPRG